MKITQEARVNYTEIVMAIGAARQEKSYLTVEMIAQAIAKGIGKDLPFLIKELKKIDPKQLWEQER